MSWWGIDHENPEFHVLPSELQQEILQSDEPVTDVRDRGYDPLLTISLKSEFVGVKNEYLSERISKILGKKILVEGKEETLLTCPCCKYQTLMERGQYDICPVCFWEEDGSDEPTHYSGPNHMTLAEGRENFIKYGAVTEMSLQFIKIDAKRRYFKADSE
ncbi:Cysteine-rich CPCC [Melghirimyces algeriensis]|uniref:Cysteine-rich CPCC n=1 Tax=Melghirimyces algeriensis TaxID=910412 RepID=A0A521C085_9BACL|nr:Cysteine-rich CPCC [Melghirimyces algeriensis]